MSYSYIISAMGASPVAHQHLISAQASMVTEQLLSIIFALMSRVT